MFRFDPVIDGLTANETVGAFTLGGVFVLVRDEVPHDFFDEVEKSVRPSLVTPNELSWTSDLSKLPDSSTLQIRSR